MEIRYVAWDLGPAEQGGVSTSKTSVLSGYGLVTETVLGTLCANNKEESCYLAILHVTQ